MDYEELLIEPGTELRPATIRLHGMCADSSWTCAWLAYFDMSPQWQVSRAQGLPKLSETQSLLKKVTIHREPWLIV